MSKTCALIGLLCYSGLAFGQLEVKISADDGAADDWFGATVAIDGDTAVAGALYDDDGGSDSGSAYVFYRDMGGADAWGQVEKLSASDATAGDYFGYPVSIDGDTVIIGALHKDMASGAAYIFYRNQGGADAWNEVAKLTASDTTAGDRFGEAVTVDGDAAIIGADGDDDLGSYSGSAYVFYRNYGGNDLWGEVVKLTAPDGVPEGQFGSEVALDGDTAVVSAPGDDDAGMYSGSVHIFYRNESGADAWGHVAKLTASDAAAGDFFGSSISIYGDTVVIGVRNNSDAGNNSGSAYVFNRNQGGTDTWGEVAKLTASDAAENDNFGLGVSVYGNTAVIGAFGVNTYAGAFYIFKETGGSWSEQAKLTASDGAPGDQFGSSLAVYGDTAVIGALGDDDSGNASGSAYLFSGAPVPVELRHFTVE